MYVCELHVFILQLVRKNSKYKQPESFYTGSADRMTSSCIGKNPFREAVLIRAQTTWKTVQLNWELAAVFVLRYWFAQNDSLSLSAVHIHPSDYSM